MRFTGPTVHLHTQLEEYGSAVQDATKAIEVNHKYTKRGAAYLAMGKFKEAFKDFKKIELIITQ
ncbi:hypothetical protein ACP4OV_031506 [Aristida adscensionis]